MPTAPAVAAAEAPPPAQGPSGAEPSGGGDEQVAMTVPQAPVTAPPKPSAADSFAGVVRFLQTHDDGGCFVAMPSTRPGGLLGLDGFTDDGARLTRFVRDFETATSVAANPSSAVVSPAQCRALAFARTLPRYPKFSLRFALERRDLGNGEALSGTILNSADRPIHLLVVDDEGKVQSLDRHVVRSASGVSFAAPMTLTAGPVATVQLLVALSGDKPFETLDALNGKAADAFFDALTEEIAARGIATDLAIASFSVR